MALDVLNFSMRSSNLPIITVRSRSRPIEQTVFDFWNRLRSTDSVIAYWNVSGGESLPGVVATYQHDYQNGVVIDFGVFGTDIIAQSYQTQFFLLAAIDPINYS
jgi:hypothetical protein